MRPDLHISVQDETVWLPKLPTEDISQPDYNILIMGEFPKGATNKIVQYRPGETSRFIRNVAAPDCTKYGIGPQLAVSALNNNIGVLVANLRPDDAKMANIALSVMYKVDPARPKLNGTGQALFLTPEGQEVTVSTGNTPIVRDVLVLKFKATTSSTIVDNESLQTALDANLITTADAQGWKTIPLVAFRYQGASSYGNNYKFRFIPTKGTDGMVYYRMEIYTGAETTTVQEVVSLFPKAYLSGTSAYVENVVNKYDLCMRAITSSHIDKFFDLLYLHFATLADDPMSIDLFAAKHYNMETDSTSIKAALTGAFTLAQGSDGTPGGLDTQISALLNGSIVPDIKSILRYKISYIPDLKYSNNTKQAIATFTGQRMFTTLAGCMLGDKSFDDALTDRNGNFAGDYPHLRFIAAAQSPYRFDDYVRRNIKMPASYYDTMSLIRHMMYNGNLNMPFAGPKARWNDYDEETMVYPKEDGAFLDLITNARINVTKKDRASGSYLFTQDMGTLANSDMQEFNNRLILARIIYDVADLAHSKNYGFSDKSDIAKYNEDIALEVLPTYMGAVSGITANVYKKGLTGEDKNTNIIAIKVNFKDINKVTEVNITITDEELTTSVSASVQ